MESWADNTYGLDRWIYTNCIFSSLDDGITLRGNGSPNGCDFQQKIEKNTIKIGEQYSFSARVDGEVIGGTTTAITDTTCGTYEDERLRMFLYFSVPYDCWIAYFRFKDTVEHTIEWAKLEIGDAVTPYIPRLYDEEKLLCQRYYRILRCCEKPYYMSTDVIHFTVSSYDKYFGLVKRPTMTILDGVIMDKGSTQTGYSLSALSIGEGRLNYTFTKTAHGLTNMDVILGEVVVALDAEL